MSRRYNRRSSRPLEDLPSLFSRETAEHSAVGSDRPDTPAPAGPDDLSLDPACLPAGPRLMYMSFGSGSSGNCSYVGTADCGLLVDGGVDNNFVTEQLLRSGIDMSSVRGILLTHDHADHVRYSYALLRRNPHMRLYATPRALEGLLRRHNISRRIKDYHAPIYKEHEYRFGPITVIPFETSHDGTDNAGYCIRCGSTVMVIATDMGEVTPRADYYIRQATSLMIEADYDSAMLATGRYPEYLKARIISDTGHLDNMVTARYLADIWTPVLREVYLCHLSQDNNAPEIALAAVRERLAERNVCVITDSSVASGDVLRLSALPRFKSSPLYILRPVEE